MTEAPLRQEIATAYNAARLPHPAACHLFHARSTVATMTEIHDFLRVPYTRVGTAHCPECGTVLEAQPRDQIVERILTARQGQHVMVLAPLVFVPAAAEAGADAPEAAATRIKSPARTTPPGLPGRNSWPGWGRSFRSSARTVAATSGSSR